MQVIGIGIALLINDVAVGITGWGEDGIGQPGLLPVSKGDKLTLAGTDGNYPSSNDSDARRLSMLRFFPIKKHGINYSGITGGGFGGVDYENVIHPGKFTDHWTGIQGGQWWWCHPDTDLTTGGSIPAGEKGAGWSHYPYYLPEENKPKYNTFYEWEAPKAGIWYLNYDAAGYREYIGIYVNRKLVQILGYSTTELPATIMLNKFDKVILINFRCADNNYVNGPETNQLDNLKNSNKWDGICSYNCFRTWGEGQGFGVRLWLSNFYPFKESFGNTVENNSANGIYYRKHSDGFLEMWSKISDGTVGNKTINFPINFIDDNYSVTTAISNGRRDGGSFVYVDKTTVSGMTIYVSSISTVRWKAEGYWK